MRRARVFAASAAAMLVLMPSQSRAGQIPSNLIVTAAVSTTSPAPGSYTSVFDGAGHGTHTAGQGALVTTNVFHMSISASECCTVHSFVLGPWNGTWTLAGGSVDSLSGTAQGTIPGSCFWLGIGFGCDTPSLIGGGVSLTLTITGGTGRYANATGSGLLTGNQTVQDVDFTPYAPALFEGQLKLSGV